MTATATKILPFGIQIDNKRNQDAMLQCVPGQRLRTAIKASRTTIDPVTGNEGIPQDQAIHLGQLPPIPGQEIHVNPDKLTYRVIDPLHDDEDMCNRIRKHMDKTGAFRTEGKLDGVPPQSGTLDKHRMKSLCRELMWLVDAGDAKMAKGAKPTMEDIEGLPGNFLLNPGSRVPNGQPKFEKDYDAWSDGLNKSGG